MLMGTHHAGQQTTRHTRQVFTEARHGSKRSQQINTSDNEKKQQEGIRSLESILLNEKTNSNELELDNKNVARINGFALIFLCQRDTCNTALKNCMQRGSVHEVRRRPHHVGGI